MSNLCPNPSVANNDVGWANGTRTAVSGFDRPYAKRFTGTTDTIFIGGPAIPVAAGQEMTFSFSGRCSEAMTLRLYVDYFSGSNSAGDSGSKSHPLSANVVSRGFQRVTIPAGVTTAMLSVYFNLPSTSAILDVTMLRYTVGTDSLYFDGDSEGWEWTGASGNSTSIQSAPVLDQLSGVKIWNGSSWINTPKQKVYNGSAWV